ncbi:MAG: Npun_F0494 family protein [Cyanobacteria bacterium J06639_1]
MASPKEMSSEKESAEGDLVQSNLVQSNLVQSDIAYSDAIYRRAERALRCSPFTRRLVESLRDRSVDLSEISGQRGLDKGFTTHVVPELAAESAMAWLIQVGALRHEVDGQGITSRYRLSLIGRQLLDRLSPADDLGGTAGLVDWVGDRLTRLGMR